LALAENPGFDLRDVWLKYRVRYHRPRSLRAVVTSSTLGAVRRDVRRLLAPRSSARNDEAFWALRGITLSAGPGDVVGIVGSNGAGKSTLLRVMARIIKPDRGIAIVRGTVGTLLTFGAGFNPDLTGRENVFLNGAILGLTQNEIKDRLDAIVELAGVGDFFDAPVSTYSSGMRARLGFSVAVHVNPDVLLVDEVVQVGDAFFQKKAGSILDQFRGQNKVIALVTHSPGAVERYCTRAVWMEHGAVRREGPPAEVMAEYLAWSEAQVRAAKTQRRSAAV
jgi:ABC-type polysaccharide/polyol phosphate transport system ATPase subunit